jgi:hypothetical protein
VTKIFKEQGLQEIIAAEYAKHGVKYLTPVWASPYHFPGKRPIRGIEDMRKMKIRTVGASTKMLSNTPVAHQRFSNTEFTGFVLNHPDFSKLLVSEDWLVQLPEMADFLANHAQFLEAHPQIAALLP